MTVGIDYGMGRTNRDVKTGIRFGCISQHSIMPECLDSIEYDYGDPTCPKCGGTAIPADKVNEELAADWEQLYSGGCQDFACETCKIYLDSLDVYGEEALGWHYSEDGYDIGSCLDSDIMVMQSPYYTTARFCSPCVPGAGNLDSPDDDGVETYCLGHDWFESGTAPYSVYSVATRELVAPSK